MYHKCYVPGCDFKRQDDILLHKFPANEKIRKKWLQSINCASLSALSVVELCKRCVCHKHFEARFITQKSRLLVRAYPTLFTEHEISTGVPARSDLDNQSPSPKSEHNYCRTEHIDHNYAAPRPTNEENNEERFKFGNPYSFDTVPSSKDDLQEVPQLAPASTTELKQQTPKKKGTRLNTKLSCTNFQETLHRVQESEKTTVFIVDPKWLLNYS